MEQINRRLHIELIGFNMNSKEVHLGYNETINFG